MADPQLLSTDPQAGVAPSGQLLSVDPRAGVAAAKVNGQNQTAPFNPPRVKGWTDTAVDLLPTAGGIVGGLVGGAGGTVAGMGVGGVPGAIGGAMLGGAAGEAVRSLVNNLRDGNPIVSPADTAKDIAIQGVGQGAAELAGAGVVKGVGALGKWMMNRATTRVTAQLAREFPELSDTLIDHALTVSEGGYGKAKSLLMAAKSKATDALALADNAGHQVPVQLSDDLAESLKTALLDKAIKAGKIAPPAQGHPVTSALNRLTGPMKSLFQQIDFAAKNDVPLLLKPSEADLFKTQLQKESRALYLNRFTPNGAKAMEQDSLVRADYASKLNEAIDALATGYKAANAEAQPLIGAVRGLKQAIRPSGNLYQAMVRPAVGATLGAMAGEQEGGKTGAAVGGVLGAALTSPANLSREAIILSHPALQAVLRQMPKPFAQKVIDVLGEILPAPAAPSTPPGASQ